jgi:hypothetical protein
MLHSAPSSIALLLNPEKYRAERFKKVCSRYIAITEEVLRSDFVASLRMPSCAEGIMLIPEICALALGVSSIPSSSPVKLPRYLGVDRAIHFKEVLATYISITEQILLDPLVAAPQLQKIHEALLLLQELCDLGKKIYVIHEPDPKFIEWQFRCGEFASDRYAY